MRMGNEYVRQILLSPVADVALETPLTRLDRLSERLQRNIWIKREDLQPVHSFKLRGAYHKLTCLSADQLATGVIAASAGNHAQGLALSAQRLGVKALVVMPETTPEIKVQNVRRYGADIILVGKSFNEASDYARKISLEKRLTYISAFDDEDVIVGQGTVARELLQQHAKADAIFVPVGGGGLLAGVAVFIKHIQPRIRIIGVEAEDSACLQAARAAGQPVTLDHVGLFADGVAVRRIGDETFRLAQQNCDDVITVNSDEICAAVKELFDECRAIAEPSGALGLAGLKAYVKRHPRLGSELVTILSGANLNFDSLRYIAERCELGEQKEGILAVTIPERKGSFREFCRLIGERHVTEFNYRFADPKNAHIFVGIGLRNGRADLEIVMRNLQQSGYEVIDLSDNELAKLHVRYMVGGRSPAVARERLLSFEFPESPGALMRFLDTLGGNWNISLFHYRNHGAAFGDVLAGFEVPAGEQEDFERHLTELGFPFRDESQNPVYGMFLFDPQRRQISV